MTEYTKEIQKLFLEIILSDSESFIRVQNIFDRDNFDRALQSAADFILDHANKYKAVPTIDQLNAVCENIEFKRVDGLSEDHLQWFLTEFESFTRQRALNRAILQATDLIEKGEYAPVEKLVKDAIQISLTKDLGTDYFLDPRDRLMRLKSNNGQVSTGWNNLDRVLYGGFNKGELQIVAGGSGSGKSLFMQNLSVNWLQAGLSGVYITLELSEELCSMRIDGMVTDTHQKEIFKDIDNVEMKLGMLSKKYGKFRIKYMPAQSTVNDIRSYLKELKIQTGQKIDFLCIDYLDLLMPVSAKVSPSDLFIKDKYVSEEIRNLAKELNVLLVTASQLNRSAVEEVEFDHSHISGGISKINTADNVFGIFTSRAMRERGKYQLQCMKTRSSSGVGQKIDLDFNVETLRIVDSVEGSGSYSRPHEDSILNKIKISSNVKSQDQVEKAPTVEAGSNKIKQMLAGLKSGNTLNN